ncbi:hypothetical protein H6F51_23770 [Cyanobacteria bacterium FACHB-DQ100]|nr:hypothetical protein [Cyanobacteria bacterium FACHB-DQ100]
MTCKTTVSPDMPEFDRLKLEETRRQLMETYTTLDGTEVNPDGTGIEPGKTDAKPAVKLDKTGLSFPLSFKDAVDGYKQNGLVCNPSTLKGSWMQKFIKPAYEYVNCPEIQDKKGQITEFGFDAIGEVIARCIQGENGDKIAVETLREELVDRYGAKAVKDKLAVAATLLEMAKNKRDENAQAKQTSALVKQDAKSRLEILQEAIETLNEGDDDDAPILELTEEEKARIMEEEMAKHLLAEQYRQQVKSQLKKGK